MRSIRAMSFNPTTGGRGTFFFHPFLRKKGGGEERKKSGRSFPGRPSPRAERAREGPGSALGATELAAETTSYASSTRRIEPPAMGRTSPTLRRAWPKDGPLAAICVQSVDVQCVLQFTLVHAAGCVLHRRTSRVIHRLKLLSVCFFAMERRPQTSGPAPQRLCGRANREARTCPLPQEEGRPTPGEARAPRFMVGRPRRLLQLTLPNYRRPRGPVSRQARRARPFRDVSGVSLSDAVDVATLVSTASPQSAAPTTVSQGGERKLTSRRHRSHRTFCGPSVTGLPGSLTAVVRDAESPCAFTLADSQAGNTGSRRRGETTISPLDPRLGERTPSGHQIAFTCSYSFALVTSDSVDKQKQHGYRSRRCLPPAVAR
ncbi:hypothetical protein ACOMHN_057018 [Nucella lapillus]